MNKRILIIGAVALGPKIACRLKRLEPDTQITMIDRDDLISYGGCGIPYYIGGDVSEIKGLLSTNAHVVRDSEFFEKVKGVRVLIRTEAVHIDRSAKQVKVRYLDKGTEDLLEYDQLVLATGSTPFCPPIEGIDLSGVFVVSNLHHAKRIKDMIAKGKVSNAVVIGGGAIGIEMAEALTDLWEIETTLVEMADQLLPTALGYEMAAVVQKELEEKNLTVLTSEKIFRILGNNENQVTGVETSDKKIPCDMVILSAGIRPCSELARKAGLDIGKTGGIKVDTYLRTSDPDIYAGGDCVEIPHILSNKGTLMPLGSLANRQGRVIGSNLSGRQDQFKGTTGAFCLKVFDLGVARAGLTVNQAVEAGFDPKYSLVVQSDRAHFYPSMELMHLKLIADKNTRKILGIECIGPNGDAVKARVDAVSAIIPYGAVISDVANLEVAYSPPYASAMDIINSAANTLENIIEGRELPVDADEFLDRFKNTDIRVLDVRSPVQAQPYVEKYKDRWINIDQHELKSRLSEIPADEELFLVCGSGSRSYEAQLLLRYKNVNLRTLNIQGGIGMIKALDPDFIP